MTTTAAEGPGMRPILEVARDLGISPDHLEPYGRDKLKVRLEALDRASSEHAPGKLVLVSAITPPPAGDGKTTTSIRPAQGLRRAGKHGADLPQRHVAAEWDPAQLLRENVDDQQGEPERGNRGREQCAGRRCVIEE